MKASQKYTLLGSLWFMQMVPMGFFLTAVPTILRQQGSSLEEIGLVGLVALPWALKFLWAPVVDLYGSQRIGHYRSWILPLQSLLVVALGLTAQFDLRTNFRAFLVLCCVICFVSATQDIATDALAVNLLAPAERGWANGLQTAANFSGSIVGGGLMLVLYSRLGWQGSMLVVALMVALPLLAVWRVREPVRVAHETPPTLKTALHLFRRDGMMRWLLLAASSVVGYAVTNAMFRPFLVDLQLPLEEIALMTGILNWVAGLLGGLCGGALIRPLGRRSAILSLNLFLAVSLLAQIALGLGWNSRVALYALSSLTGFAVGAAYVALTTIVMDHSRRETAGTDYTVQVSMFELGSMLAGGGSGFLAARFGYAGTFATGALLSWLSVFLLWRYFRPALTETAEGAA